MCFLLTRFPGSRALFFRQPDFNIHASFDFTMLHRRAIQCAPCFTSQESFRGQRQTHFFQNVCSQRAHPGPAISRSTLKGQQLWFRGLVTSSNRPSTVGSQAAASFPSGGFNQISRGYTPEPQQSATVHAMTEQEEAQMKRELKSLNVAIVANILICIAKVWVHLISGSSAMLAEALHSVADILNQVLLRVGVLKAKKAPTAQHPYGYMRDRFVWSLISAVGIFFLGAGASVFHGLHTLTETRVIEGAVWSYAVLGVSALLEGYSLWVAARCVMEGAKSRNMALVPYITSGVDPTTVAVLLEDGGAVAGLFIAGVCTALTHWTGNAMFDALGSIAIGGLLGLIAVFLVQKNRDLLLGRSMSNKETEEVLCLLRGDPVVLYVTETKTEEIGPRVFRFKAEVAWDGDRLVERYLERCGREKLVARLQAALEAEQVARERGGTSASVDAVLKSYGRDIINAVGAEVDRIETEIQAINPGIRYVDLETDRGRYPGPPSKTPTPPPREPGTTHDIDSAGGSPGPGPSSSSSVNTWNCEDQAMASAAAGSSWDDNAFTSQSSDSFTSSGASRAEPSGPGSTGAVSRPKETTSSQAHVTRAGKHSHGSDAFGALSSSRQQDSTSSPRPSHGAIPAYSCSILDNPARLCTSSSHKRQHKNTALLHHMIMANGGMPLVDMGTLPSPRSCDIDRMLDASDGVISRVPRRATPDVWLL